MRSRIHKRIKRSNVKIEPIFLLKHVLIVFMYFIIFISLDDIISRAVAIQQFEKDIDEFAMKNTETIFEIKEITLYSSANARINTQSANLGIDISQFADVSFYISNPKGKVIKSLKISNITFNPIPEIRDTCNCI